MSDIIFDPMPEKDVYTNTVVAANEAANHGDVTTCGDLIRSAWELNPDMTVDYRASILAKAYRRQGDLVEDLIFDISEIPNLVDKLIKIRKGSVDMGNALEELSSVNPSPDSVSPLPAVTYP